MFTHRNKNNLHKKREPKKPKSKEDTHKNVLEDIANHPDLIKICTSHLQETVKEPRIFKYCSKHQESQCDIVFIYDNQQKRYSILVEIKPDKEYPSMKAYNQLKNTSRMYCDRNGCPATYLMIVYYPSMKTEEFLENILDSHINYTYMKK